MNNKIYGIDLTKKITPIMARDAIVKCFKQAHQEVLNLMDEFAEWESDEERIKFRDLEIEFLIKGAFKNSGSNYEEPTKLDLFKVLDKLTELASKFRKPDIVGKHYGEIKKILEKVE